ncbi:hypothetical protein PUN28_018115 [Cardiocondyla obscurior]|uniref:Uncharacterized protein n=1 Tax=Cardiocondyla obscurior TaxID=286306 RepID=A0AAW2EHC6_9HYME
MLPLILPYDVTYSLGYMDHRVGVRSLLLLKDTESETEKRFNLSHLSVLRKSRKPIGLVIKFIKRAQTTSATCKAHLLLSSYLRGKYR